MRKGKNYNEDICDLIWKEVGDHPNLCVPRKVSPENSEDEEQTVWYTPRLKIDLEKVPSGVSTTNLKAAVQMARGLVALHAHNIYHLDVKLSNAMFDGDPDDEASCVRLIDFEYSKKVTDPEEFVGCGTNIYNDPVLASGPEGGARVDQFSWGLACFELWCRPDKALLYKIRKKKVLSIEDLEENAAFAQLDPVLKEIVIDCVVGADRLGNLADKGERLEAFLATVR